MPLVSLRDAIAEAWEAIEPPIDSGRRYRHVDVALEGASGHRAFYFRTPAGDGITEQGATRHMITHRFEAVLGLHIPDRTKAQFERPYREYQALAPIVSTIRVARVHVPKVVSYRVEDLAAQGQGEDGDFDLVLVIEARTKESTAP